MARLGDDIAERLLNLATNVIRTVGKGTRFGWRGHLSVQLVRAITSAGANYEEARHAESRADFVHKVGVASKELAEALYWMKILARIEPTSGAAPLLPEADELISILVASARTARSRL